MNQDKRTPNESLRKHPRQWQEITELSESMLNAAQKKDWEQLNELVLSRQELLSDYFEGGLSAQQAELAQQDISALQDTDKEIIVLTQFNKDLLAEAMMQLRRGRKMAAQYLSTGG